MRIALFAIFIILCSCTNNKQDLKPNPLIPKKNTSSENAKLEFSISISGQTISLNKSEHHYSSEESAEISFPNNVYVYTWQRQGDTLSLLGEYTFSKEEQETKFLSLKDFTQDTDWFIFTSKKPLGISKNQVRNSISKIHNTKSSYAIKPYNWNIYTVAAEEMQSVNLQTRISVFHTPFSCRVLSKNINSQIFEPQKKQKLTANSELKFQVEIFEPVYFAMFLCSVDATKVTSVSQVFPQNNAIISQLSNGFKWEAKLRNPVKISEVTNEQWLYCFAEKQSLDKEEIKQWLSTKVRGFDAIVSLTTGEVQTLDTTQDTNILGEEKNVVVVEKDFPHVKVRLQTN